MAPAKPPKPRQRAPFFDVHPQTGATIEVFYAPGTGDVRQMRRGMVLVASRTRSCASRLAYGSVCNKLRRVSTRDEPCGPIVQR
jgi:hypothetical protein